MVPQHIMHKQLVLDMLCCSELFNITVECIYSTIRFINIMKYALHAADVALAHWGG